MAFPISRRGLAIAAIPLAVAALAALRRSPAEAQQTPPSTPVLTLADWPMSESATRGRVVYERWCAGCHGDDGRGQGPAARHLDPLPRDFQAGRIKFRSTPQGSLPLAEDLIATITRGLPGSSMPEFRLLPDPHKRDVAEYVIALVQFGRAARAAEALARGGESREAILRDNLKDWLAEAAADRASVRPVAVGPEPADDAASRARGKALYLEKCHNCHGESGRGDGSAAGNLRDALDANILPRDFTRGSLRGGDAPEDVFRRLRTGIDGTPMPAYTLSDQDTWDLVHYAMSFRSAAGKGGAKGGSK
ncbi:MAG: hypothetical protein HMLKMBBP_01477 [Planctomycetes bacterium]|nr:hypothetical protein [Planctomycetota bacterium]